MRLTERKEDYIPRRQRPMLLKFVPQMHPSNPTDSPALSPMDSTKIGLMAKFHG
jgi:hypothetical protein